jgi:hypothetical protein
MSDPEQFSTPRQGSEAVSAAPNEPQKPRAPSFRFPSGKRVGDHGPEPVLAHPHRQPQGSNADPEDEPSQGPNLVLIYSLIALALAVAIGFAMMIVFPFYLRR